MDGVVDLAERCGKPLFQPIWKHRYIDHVQISVAESIGAGERAGYYRDSGVLREHGAKPHLADPALGGHGAWSRPPR